MWKDANANSNAECSRGKKCLFVKCTKMREKKTVVLLHCNTFQLFHFGDIPKHKKLPFIDSSGRSRRISLVCCAKKCFAPDIMLCWRRRKNTYIHIQFAVPTEYTDANTPVWDQKNSIVRIFLIKSKNSRTKFLILSCILFHKPISGQTQCWVHSLETDEFLKRKKVITN